MNVKNAITLKCVLITLNKDKKGDYHCDKYMDKKKFSSFLSMLLTNIENNQ